MSQSQIFLMSCRVEPAAAVETLRSRGGLAGLIGSDKDWSELTIQEPKRFLRKTPSLKLIHSPPSYTGQTWIRHLNWLCKMIGDWPPSPQQQVLRDFFQHCQFSLVAISESSLEWNSDSVLLQHVVAIAERLGAIIILGNDLREIRNSSGGLILSRNGGGANAVIPEVPPGLPTAAELFPVEPPAAVRIARRAMILAGISARAMYEVQRSPTADREAARQQLVIWFHQVGLIDEAEPYECKVLMTPVGELPPHVQSDASWKAEASGVLSWALGLMDLPAYDRCVDLNVLFQSLCVNEVAAGQSLIVNAKAMPLTEREQFRKRMMTLHWRLRSFDNEPEYMDFVKTVEQWEDLRFDVRGLWLVNRDLSVGGIELANAGRADVNRLQDIVMERHVAASWLCDGGLFSESDTST